MSIKLIVVDVDGTLTDAGIYYDENGNEIKKFCTKDAAGFFAAHSVGIEIMVLTGRECAATTRRMTEMKVDYLFQNVKNKVDFLRTFMSQYDLKREEVGYIGDDLNDLPPMMLVDYIGCPADSCLEIKKIADYVSNINGGHGAVRDVIEHILRESGQWDKAVADVYGVGI
ncbi:MAG: HAD hydrolase family protein [Clostridiaceae bacterium]|nr:HAD hydrolase family protein [Clostridiaceae bacterium]